MSAQEGSAEIRSKNVIGRSMTAPLPVLSPSSILPSPSFQSAFIPATKISSHLSKMILFQFVLLILYCLSL